jgi:hypothetical protein
MGKLVYEMQDLHAFLNTKQYACGQLLQATKGFGLKREISVVKINEEERKEEKRLKARLTIWLNAASLRSKGEQAVKVAETLGKCKPIRASNFQHLSRKATSKTGKVHYRSQGDSM